MTAVHAGNEGQGGSDRGLHGCSHGASCPCYPKPSQKDQKLVKKPRGKSGPRKRPKVDISALAAQSDWENIRAQVLSRPSGGVGSWRGDRFILMQAGKCERCGENLAAEAHHRKLTAQGGPDKASNLAALCRDCHNWCHAHPPQARRAGWIVPAHADETVRPFFLWDGSVALPDDDYGYGFQGSFDRS